MARHVGDVVDGFAPVEGVFAVGEHVAETQPLTHLPEDVIVAHGLAERLDALLLEHDEPVVRLVVAVGVVTGVARPLADVPALEVGAGREDDVGELRLTLEPDGLRDHHRQVLRAVHLHVAVGGAHGADLRTAVLVEEMHLRVAVGGVVVAMELLLDAGADEAAPAPLRVAVQDGLGQKQTVQMRAGGRHDVGPRRMIACAVREQPRRQGEGRRRVLRVAADAAVRVAGEVEVAVHRRALGGASRD